MSHQNPPQPGPFGPPQPQGTPGGAPGWGQGNPPAQQPPNSAWQQQPNQAWGTQPNQAWGAQPNQNWGPPTAAAPGGPSAPRHIPGQPDQPTAGQQPLGAPRQPSISIEQFQPPRRNRLLPILLIIVVAAVVAGLLYYGLRPDPIGQSSAGPSASPASSSASPKRTVTPPAPGEYASETLFESDRVSGLFKLNGSHWEGDTLVADVTIEVDTGSLNYAFFTMDMATGDVYEPNAPSQASDLPGGTIQAGESATGTVRITKPHGDTQLILGDLAGRSLTMLAIKA